MNDTRPSAAEGGLLVSLRRFIATALELGQVRLELLGTELEEQKLRILGALAWAALGVMLVGVGVVLLVGCVVMLFWEGYRLPALAVLMLAFLGGGALMLRHAVGRLQTPPGAFAASVAELARDRAALGPRGEAPPTPP
jgi:uncharacterized membrane protein YqjE